MSSINLKFTSCDIVIKLRSTPTANAIKSILPCKSIIQTWGEEIYFEIPTQKDLSLDNTAKDVINLGEIAYWKEGKSIAIGYGRTPISHNNEIRLAAKTNIWGDAKLNIEKLKNVKDGDEVIIS